MDAQELTVSSAVTSVVGKQCLAEVYFQLFCLVIIKREIFARTPATLATSSVRAETTLFLMGSFVVMSSVNFMKWFQLDFAEESSVSSIKWGGRRTAVLLCSL